MAFSSPNANVAAIIAGATDIKPLAGLALCWTQQIGIIAKGDAACLYFVIVLIYDTLAGPDTSLVGAHAVEKVFTHRVI
jgi:hypothetical protein